MHANILKTLHDGPLGGHLGITRTEERIRKRFYWPNIRKTVTELLQLCQVCNQKNTPPHGNPAPLGHISVSQPFTFWAMDYMGPLPETSRRNKHILVVVDHFTKWCEAFPTPDQKASTVAPLLVSRIFSRFGLQQFCIPTKVEILKALYCTKYAILWALRKHKPPVTILNATDRPSGQIAQFRLCFRLFGN